MNIIKIQSLSFTIYTYKHIIFLFALCIEKKNLVLYICARSLHKTDMQYIHIYMYQHILVIENFGDERINIYIEKKASKFSIHNLYRNRITLRLVEKETLEFTVRRCVLRTSGNAVSTWLRLPILIRISAGRIRRVTGQPFGTARGCLQALLRPSAAIRTSSIEYRNLAGIRLVYAKFLYFL